MTGKAEQLLKSKTYEGKPSVVIVCEMTTDDGVLYNLYPIENQRDFWWAGAVCHPPVVGKRWTLFIRKGSVDIETATRVAGHGLKKLGLV